MKKIYQSLLFCLTSACLLMSLPACQSAGQNSSNKEEPINEDYFGMDVEKAIANNEELYLSSEQIGTKNAAVKVTKEISTVVENNGTSISYSSYFVPKGLCSDGTYFYIALNATAGTTKGSGYDVGILAKFDTNLNIIDFTEKAYAWGNKVRLNYYNGDIYVTATDASDASSYADSKLYNNKILKFDRTLDLIDDNYTFTDFTIPDGAKVEQIGNIDNHLAVLFNKDGERNLSLYTLKDKQYIYQKDIPNFYQTANGLKLNGMQAKNNYLYALYFVNGACEIGVYNWEGERLFLKGIDEPAEGKTSQNFNYQGICEINGRIYYAISSWDKYTGFGFYQLKDQYYNVENTRFTVTIDTLGAQKDVISNKVSYGSLFKPTIPKHEYTDPLTNREYKFVFEDFYLDETETFDLREAITHDYLLKAKWTFKDSFFVVKENAEVRAEGTMARIMSYNVLADDYNNRPPVDDERANQAFNTIERYQPDVVGLQEYDDEWYAQGDKLLDGYTVVNRQNNKISGTTNYSTLAYNAKTVKLIDYEQIRLNPSDNNNCRNITRGLFEFISGANIGKQFVVTSNHWNLTESERVKQANLIADYYHNWKNEYGENIPIFMTGDWNSKDNSSSYNTLLEKAPELYDTKHAETLGLICSNYHLGNGLLAPTKTRTVDNAPCWLRGRESFLPANVKSTVCVDHIFAAKNVRSLFADTVVDDDALSSSDHAPIYADLKW